MFQTIFIFPDNDFRRLIADAIHIIAQSLIIILTCFRNLNKEILMSLFIYFNIYLIPLHSNTMKTIKHIFFAVVNYSKSSRHPNTSYIYLRIWLLLNCQSAYYGFITIKRRSYIMRYLFIQRSHMVLYKVKRNFDKRQKKFLHHPKNPKQHNTNRRYTKQGS